MKHINKVTIIIVIVAVAFVSFLIFNPGFAESTSTDEKYVSEYFNPHTVNTISITISDDDWADILDNPRDKEYHKASIQINGDTYEYVGIRTKGLGSLGRVASSDSNRYSFKIKSDEYINGQSFLGLNKFVLNNSFQDPSYMKEYLSYQLLTELNVPTPLYAYAAVYVNGEYWGLYLMVEAVEEDFAIRNFGMDYGQLYKPDPLSDNGSKGHGGSDLVYVDDNIDSYPDIFENSVFSNVTKDDKQRVVTAIKHLNEGTELEKYINVDEVLRFFAVNTALVNIDSYLSNLHHNYYLYEKDGQLSIIPWDWNLSFGMLSGATSSYIVNYPIDTPVVSMVKLSECPMLESLLAVDSYKNTYHEYLKKIATEFFGDSYEERINKIDAMISPYVEKDPTAFHTYDEYKFSVDFLKEFGKYRALSILGQVDGIIPSTREGQADNPSSLIEATELDKYRKFNQKLLGGL